jgi:hypothetical protein
MSKEPIRYECTDEGMKIYGSGSFVLYSDYSTLRAQLADRNKEIEQLNYHSCKCFDGVVANPCGYVIMLLDRAEKAEAENIELRELGKKLCTALGISADQTNEQLIANCVELREKLKGIEEVYKKFSRIGVYREVGIMLEMWQAILQSR